MTRALVGRSVVVAALCAMAVAFLMSRQWERSSGTPVDRCRSCSTGVSLRSMRRGRVPIAVRLLVQQRLVCDRVN